MRFYIADNHFFHKNMVIRMDKRPFNSVEEMNEHMIEKWNSRVRKNDEVVILGDFSFGNIEQTSKLLNRLNGRLYLIRGNHDKVIDRADFDTSRFNWIKDYAEMHDSEDGIRRKVILCHYPIMMYNGQYRVAEDGTTNKVYMLCGHIHDTHDNDLLDQFKIETRKTMAELKGGIYKSIPSNIINCFCMFSDYVSLTLTEWIELDKRRMEQKAK